MPTSRSLEIFVGSLVLTIASIASSAIGQDAQDATESPSQITLRNGDHSLATYNAGFVPSPLPDAPWYGRSGFIHPVMTPHGHVVTAGFPEDHMHQHGLMFAWTSSQVAEQPVDFWNSHRKQGHIEHVKTISSNETSFEVLLKHVDDTQTAPQTVLEETWKVHVVPHDRANVVDLHSVQRCVMETPLKIKEYHYGGMCIRGPVAWLKEAGTLTTNEGLLRIEGNHSRPTWVAMTGSIDGEPCGIAAMSHPENFRAPQPVRLHGDKPYFCFAPMVLGDFEIEPGKPYTSRFRFVAFDGDLDADLLNALADDFAKSR